MNILLDIYCNEVLGEDITDPKIIKNNELIINYLKESGITGNEVFKTIMGLEPTDTGLIELSMLPDTLWDNSLLKKDTFYYHKELKILPPPPSMNDDKEYVFYCEMKIRYTEKDILKYFCKIYKVREDWVDENKEIGSIKFLLKQYERFSFMEPVDFILHLIDYVSSLDTNTTINSILQLRNYETELAQYLLNDTQNAERQGKNKIIWRTSTCVM